MARLNDVLNLNLPVLKNNRKYLLDAVLEWWRSVRRLGLAALCRATVFVRKRNRHIGGDGEFDALLPSYCVVVRAEAGADGCMSRGSSLRGRLRDRHRSDICSGTDTFPLLADGFDRERAIFPETVLAFIRETQPKEWAKLESLHGDRTGAQILGDLCKWMDIHGVLATLRHGFKCYGRTLRVAFFKAAHELNPELNARYAANRVGLTRQLRFSPRSERSLDVTLSVNGVPVATLELKNPLTGQTVEDARKQYRQDRDPREPIFEFKRRTLVHFAVDTESVLMTTRLAGAATHFLPFDKGCDGGAGNPPDPKGRTYRTSYLWEEVLQRDSLLDLLARFVHLQVEEKRDDQGRKVKVETMIFPRYHQLEAVRLLVDRAAPRGCWAQRPGGAFGRQRQEQHHCMAHAPARLAARHEQRPRLRQRNRCNGPRRARSAAPGHNLPVRA